MNQEFIKWVLENLGEYKDGILVIGGFITLILVALRGCALHRSAGAAQKQANNAVGQLQTNNRQLDITEKGQVSERYIKAIDQLGSEKIAIRLGGIYGLEKLAEIDEYYELVIEVLSAFIRENAKDTGEYDEEKDDQRNVIKPYRPLTDVQAAITVLGRLPDDSPNKDFSGAFLDDYCFKFYGNYKNANLQGAKLRGANLRGANLVEAELGGANLGGANLMGANLVGANLVGAKLMGANLVEADLQGAKLWGAKLGWADLGWAKLGGAYLMGAELMGANLGGANLVDAELMRANLVEAELGGANLGGANLGEADLQGAKLGGADLRRAKNLTCEQLKAAQDWALAYRDQELACGADIPTPPD